MCSLMPLQGKSSLSMDKFANQMRVVRKSNVRLTDQKMSSLCWKAWETSFLATQPTRGKSFSLMCSSRTNRIQGTEPMISVWPSLLLVQFYHVLSYWKTRHRTTSISQWFQYLSMSFCKKVTVSNPEIKSSYKRSKTMFWTLKRVIPSISDTEKSTFSAKSNMKFHFHFQRTISSIRSDFFAAVRPRVSKNMQPFGTQTERNTCKQRRKNKARIALSQPITPSQLLYAP